MAFRKLFLCGLPTLFLYTVAFPATTATTAPGKDLFLAHCAKCHGRNGEGVKGKYKDRLQGDRNLPKLTRYIERNMPDDDPGSITPDQADAVAKYIYGAFYSREARGEKPPRIELTRFTNRQFLNSTADLLKGFTDKDTRDNGERGLRAAYYGAKYFNSDKKLGERRDHEIAFDFGENKPDGKPAGTNAFSIQWRGSVKAEETGDYEFVLKTANGARLWVNEQEEPLIDAWVASGKLTEHRGKIRLLAGRFYPIKLDFFKAAEKNASISLSWAPPHGAEQIIPARDLLPVHSSPTFVITTPFPPDDSSQGYERGVSVSKAWDEAVTAAAIETAKYVADNLDRLSSSKLDDTNRVQKLRQFCANFVTAAFHQPLSREDEHLYVDNQFRKLPPDKPNAQKDSKAAKSATTQDATRNAQYEADAVKRVVLLTLKSPRFLYRGLSARPDDYEIAARLSYALWDSLPDAELRNLATAGQLHTPAQVQAAARKMLNDSRAHSKMLGFFHHWLQVDRIESLSKDSKLYPGFTPALVADLRTSLNLFLEDTMWNEKSDYRQLLRADYAFVNRSLADFYGVNTNSLGDSDQSSKRSKESGSDEVQAATSSSNNEGGDEFFKAEFGEQPRCGVLTHPYLLASFSYQKLTSPIHRGVFLTRHIVGRSLRPPPMAMTFKDADFAPNLTMRQKVSELTKPQACQTCHSVINPLGFSLEQFDAVGRFRTTENEKPIDPVSEYITDDGDKVRLSGARDVAEFAIANEQAHNAFIQELFHHVAKQPMEAYGPDTLDHLHASFLQSNFNMQHLLVEIATLAALQSQSQ
jgi:hypothetical protein